MSLSPAKSPEPAATPARPAPAADPVAVDQQVESAATIPLFLRGGGAPRSAAAGDGADGDKPAETPPPLLSPGAGTPLDASLAGPFSSALDHNVTDVRVHRDSPVAGSMGARAFAAGRDIAFAPGMWAPGTSAGRHLLGHELAHVAQQAQGSAGAQAAGLGADAFEREADGAADRMLTGGRSGRLSPFPGGHPQLDPDSPAVGASVGAAIESPGSPDGLDVTVEIVTPRIGGKGNETSKIVLHKPVLGATAINFYAVPLGELFATPEDAVAAAKLPPHEREKHSLLYPPIPSGPPAPAATATAPSAPPAVAKPGAPAPPASATGVGAAGTTGTFGKVVSAGPLASDTPTAAFDLAGKPIGLVERAAGWGITTEYTKLAVGAASCTVLKTPSGISLIDAGVRLAGADVDAKVKARTLAKLRELVGDQPIEDILISHAHLDHVGIIDAIGKEFVVKRIHINEIQATDPTFLEKMRTFGADQRAVLEGQLRKKHQGRRAEWEADPEKTQLKPEKGALDLAFDKWVGEQVALELAKTPPVELRMLTPGKGAGDTAGSIKIADIDVVPVETTKSPGAKGEGFVKTEGPVTSILDPAYIEKLKQVKAGSSVPLDEMSSAYLMTLPNGNQLAVLPDIRVDDFRRIQATLVQELGALGAPVSFRIWDMTHHLQAGVAGKDAPAAGSGGKPAAPGGPGGFTRASELREMARLLSQLTGGKTKAGGQVVDLVIVSVDIAKVDPALVALLRAMGLGVLPAQGEQDVQVIEAIDAAGKKLQGVTSGSGLDATDPILRRSEIALENLRQTQIDLEEKLATESAAANKATAARKAELSPQRKELEKERKSLQDKIKRRQAKTDPKTPDPSVANDLADLQSQLQINADAIKAIDEDVASTNAEAQRLAESIAETKKLIKDIKEAETAYIKKTEATAKAGKPIGPGEAAPTDPEAKRLRELVDPVYREAASTGKMGTFNEKSLVILGRKTASSPEAQETLKLFTEAQALRAKIARGELPLKNHGELISTLLELKAKLQSDRSKLGENDAQAVDAELEFIDKQIAASHEVLKEAAAKGSISTDREVGTGALIETSSFADTTTEQAQGEGAKPEPSQTDKKVADPAAPKEPGLVEKSAAKFGKAMGAVMVYQSISGGGDLLKKYGQDEAHLPETAVGVSKSALGVSIGYRMLRGAHVGMGEFVVLSVLDVTQTALQSYDSSEEFNTEVTYAIIRNGVSLALAAVGMALMELGPFGILAGLGVMFLGDPVLEALGLHEWLAKKFAFLPDENIETETALNDLIKEYAIIIGGLELAQRDPEEFKDLGAQDPEALKKQAGELADDRRKLLARPVVEAATFERSILFQFHEAYDRAAKGYAGLRELDELRARFLTLWLLAHKNDPYLDPANRDQGDPMPTTKDDITAAFANDEKKLAPDSIADEDVPRMEQWSKMNDVIADLEEILYHTDYEDVDWMKASEYQKDVQLMLSNAHYRLDPKAQGSNRATPMFSKDTPARQTYENLLKMFENKFEVLRLRSIAVANNAVSTGGDDNKPDYSNMLEPPTVDGELSNAESAVLSYNWQVGNVGELPGGLTPEQLYRDPKNVDLYKKAMDEEYSDYKVNLFALRASRTATSGIIRRMQQVSSGQALSKLQQERQGKVLEDFKRAEQERKTSGYLLWEELPQLRGAIVDAKAKPIAAALGEKPELKQLTDAEKAALATDELKDAGLSSITDRVKELGIELPEDPNEPVMGLKKLIFAPSVIVAIQPGVSQGEGSSGGDLYGEGAVFYVSVIPINAAAVAYYHGKQAQWVDDQELGLVRMKDLVAAKPKPAKP